MSKTTTVIRLLLLSLCVFAVQAQLSCRVSSISRKPCRGSGVALTQALCLARGCCYDRFGKQYQRCYEKVKISPNFFGFSPTESPGFEGINNRFWTFGGEPGYPGSRGTRKCIPNLNDDPCFPKGLISRHDCYRIGCCWLEGTSTCYKSIYHITYLRESCPPGFKDPPACRDINECAASPCLNGGVCLDKINRYECNCPAGTTGVNCENLCGPPPAAANVDWTVKQPSYMNGDTVTYSCIGTNTPQGSLTNRCILGPGNVGIWLYPSPVCVQGCASPSAPSPEVVHSPIRTVYAAGESITYSCNPASLTLVGVNVLICLSNGLWNPPAAPTCSGAVCPPVPPVTVGLGSFSPTSPVYLAIGATATYVCSPGFTMVGFNTIQCNPGATWSGPAPECHRDCGAPPAPIAFGGGDVRVVSTAAGVPYPTGSQAIYSCTLTGYQIIGSATLVCQQDGTWLPTQPPQCQNECQNLPLSSMVINTPAGTSHAPGTIVDYMCPTNYALRGASSNVCQGNLQWSQPAPECKLECPAAPGAGTPDPTHPGQANWVEGETVTYTCTSGNPIGVDVITCTGGAWVPNAEPTCGLTNCPPLPTIAANGINTPTGITFTGGVTVTYSCNVGYVLVGATTNECQAGTLMWSNAAPTCVVDCGTPPAVAASTFTGVTGVGQTITYVCNNGYILDGSSDNMCMDVGGVATWSVNAPNLPTCVQGCTKPPAGAEVTFVVDKNSYAINEKVTYSCVAGKNIVGATENECVAINTWKYVSPTCSATVCPPTPSLTDGSFTPTANLAVGTMATYMCNAEFTLDGSTTISCAAGTTMPELSYAMPTNPPTCTAFCPNLPAKPAQATAASPTLAPAAAVAPYAHGTVATYECNPGYVGVRLTQTCSLPLSTFTPAPGPDCLLGCPAPVPIKPNVGFTGVTSPFKEGDVATYQCSVSPGQIIGPYLSNKCTNGDWEISLADSPECLNECVNPPDVANGSPAPVKATYAISERVTYTCAATFIMVGDNFAECQPSFGWTAPGTCEKSCGALPFDAANLVVGHRPPPYVAGDVINYQCITPTLTRHSQVTDSNECLASGAWQYPQAAQAGVCEAVCIDPPVAANGYFSPTQATYALSSVVTYNCLVNYQLSMVTTTTCNAGSPPSWSNTAVDNCKRVCLLPAVGNGVTIAEAPPFLDGMTVTFECLTSPLITLIGAPSATCQMDGTWMYAGGLGFPSCI